MISFGPFQLLPSERRLLKDEHPVQVGSRSLDILIALVERAGEVVPRKVLLQRAWPDLVVEESSLRSHIAALRRLLGDGRNGARYVVNVPGRGYCFVARVTRIDSESTSDTPTDITGSPPSRLPTILGRMIDREDMLARLCCQVLGERFGTIVADLDATSRFARLLTGMNLFSLHSGDHEMALQATERFAEACAPRNGRRTKI